MIHRVLRPFFACVSILLYALAVEATSLQTRMIPSSDGVSIYAEALGNRSGPTLVLIHGFGLSTIVFDKQFLDANMQHHLYMIRYDMRGHGRSSKPEVVDAYTSQKFADDFQAVCHAFGVQKPYVAGWSLGGAVINDILANLPQDTISGAIEMSGFASFAVSSAFVTPLAAGLVSGIINANDTRLWKLSATTFVDNFFIDLDPIPFEVRMAWLGLYATQSPTVATFVMTRVQDVSKLWEAGQRGLPFLAISGAEDVLINGTVVADLFQQHRFTDLTVVSIQKAGHAFFYERPSVTNAALLAFIFRPVLSTEPTGTGQLQLPQHLV